MTRRDWAVGMIGLLLLLLSRHQINKAAQGLTITTMSSTEPPLTVIAPAGATRASPPLVLVGHGFAGSSVIMRGFAFSLAHAGYAVVLWDFDGHGRNPQPLPSASGDRSLLTNAEAALAHAAALGLGDPARVAILGHSMGSGVALAFGQEHPDTAATIAVSPVGQSVQEDLPRNLLLLVGSLEGRFVRNAEQRLEEAGGPGGDLTDGTARKLSIIPGVEHISILFSPTAHAAARAWLDATFGTQSEARDYVDRRVLWYGLGLIGTLLIAAALGSLVTSTPPSQPPRPLRQGLVALSGGALGATLAMWFLSKIGLELSDLLGLVVGGYLLLWFAFAGLAATALRHRGFRRLSGQDLLAGFLVFALLWLGIGLLGELVWLPWLLIPRRLVLWPLGGLLLLPWFEQVGAMMQASSLGRRLGCWLLHSALLVVALVLALVLSSELFFLILILPLFPVVLGLHTLASGRYPGSWSFALSGALFVSWLVLAVFPLR